MLSGDLESKRVEVYVGWQGYSVFELFSMVWDLQEEFFFAMDSALMVTSKGGISLQSLFKMGIRTKDKYLQQLKKLLKQMYSSEESGGEGVDVSNGEIDMEAFRSSING